MEILTKIGPVVLMMVCVISTVCRAQSSEGSDSAQTSNDLNQQQNVQSGQEEIRQRTHSKTFLKYDQSQNQAFQNQPNQWMQNQQNQAFQNQQNQAFQNQQNQAYQNQRNQAFQNQLNQAFQNQQNPAFQNQAFQNPYFQHQGYQYQTNPLYSSLLFPFLSYPIQNPAFQNQQYPGFGSFQPQQNPSIETKKNPAIKRGHSTTIFNKQNEGNQNKIPGFDIAEPHKTPEDTASSHTTWFQRQMQDMNKVFNKLSM